MLYVQIAFLVYLSIIASLHVTQPLPPRGTNRIPGPRGLGN